MEELITLILKAAAILATVTEFVNQIVNTIRFCLKVFKFIGKIVTNFKEHKNKKPDT